MEDKDDLDLLAWLLEEQEGEETSADGAGGSRDEQGVERSLEEEDDQWDELFDKEEEDDVRAKEITALFGDMDDLEEEEDGEERSKMDASGIKDAPAPIPSQKTSAKSKLELEEELERMKEQMERLQQQLTKAADGPNSTGGSAKHIPHNKLKALGKGKFSSRNVTKSQSRQDRSRPPSSPKCNVLESKLHKTPKPMKTPTEKSPQTPAGIKLPQHLQNKPNPTHRNLPAAISANEKPGTSRATNAVISVDKFSGLRLRNPIVSSTEMERKMQGRKLVRLSQVHSQVANEKLEDANWVTFGVIVKKITPQSSNNGKTFSIWNLSDLRSSDHLSLFLFGNVHKEHWKTDTGTVIGLLNANPMKPKEGSDEVSISVDHPQKILVMGEALDMGTCHARKKNGDPCTQIVNLMECEYCEYHVKAQYRKLSAKRADLQSSFSGPAPNRMNGKPCSLKEKLCQQGFHYGGRSSASYSASVKAAGRHKSVQMTLTQMMVKGADDIVTETKKNIALKTGKGLTECSDEFKDLMEMPTFGARNLKKHLTKPPAKAKGGVVNNAQPGLSIVSISAAQLLKQQKHKMLETRKRKAEELQRSFLQSKTVSNGHTSGAGGPLTQTSPRIGAEFPKEQKLMATPQMPKLGGGLSHGEDVLFFDTSPPSATKVNQAADTRKVAAIKKLHKKGAVLAKEDPNRVKRKLEPGGKLLERIEKNLSPPDENKGSDGPMTKKHRAQMEYLESEEFQKILNAKSKHVGTVKEAEIELQEQYFEPLVKKEQMEEKMKSIREMKCRVVSCKTCKYSHFKPLETCVSENHDFHWHDAVKRFFKCPCGCRAVALTRLPKKHCQNCGLFQWERDGMLKERKGPKIGGELLLPRGEEHGKFLSSSK